LKADTQKSIKLFKAKHLFNMSICKSRRHKESYIIWLVLKDWFKAAFQSTQWRAFTGIFCIFFILI